MVTVRLRPTRAWTAISKSLFIPGSGQYYRGQHTKSLLFKGLWFVSVATLASKFNNRSSRYQRLHEAVQRYEKTNHNHEECYQEVENTYHRAQSANRTLNIVIAATAVIYVVNILDAAWSVPNRGQFNHHVDTPREP
jgi:site-specific DNA-adenine methylase